MKGWTSQSLQAKQGRGATPPGPGRGKTEGGSNKSALTDEDRAAMAARRAAEYAARDAGLVAVWLSPSDTPSAAADAVRRRWEGQTPHPGDDALTGRVVALHAQLRPDA